jgi:hypothetical protein
MAQYKLNFRFSVSGYVHMGSLFIIHSKIRNNKSASRLLACDHRYLNINNYKLNFILSNYSVEHSHIRYPHSEILTL